MESTSASKIRPRWRLERIPSGRGQDAKRMRSVFDSPGKESPLAPLKTTESSRKERLQSEDAMEDGHNARVLS